MQTLFETTATLSRESTQSHSAFTFFMPIEIDKLVISFDFSPAYLDDDVQAQHIISHALDRYDGWNGGDRVSQVDKYLPLKNLLTLSIDDPNGFRGARHCHLATQKLVWSEEEVSPGMLKGLLPAGLWSITVSAHAIVTPSCTFRLKVEGMRISQVQGSLTYAPWHHRLTVDELPLNQAEQQPLFRANEAKKWLRSELHVHTNHSDGRQSVKEIAECAEQLGLDVVAITDHNTVSPLEELSTINAAADIQFLYGLEWTTFYGHMLTLGYQELTYTDWRSVGPTDLEQGLANIHQKGAIAGIAHPFRVGNPLGTGCHWEFWMNRIDNIDFIEVWNGSDPSSRYYNQKAFHFWTSLLNKGYKIPATSGRDWHHNEEEQPDLAFTYVHVDETSIANQASFRQAFITAIKKGAMTISYGPPLLLTAVAGGVTYNIGDHIKASDEAVEISVTSEQWLQGDQTIQWVLMSNKCELAATEEDQKLTFTGVPTDLKWIRAELYDRTNQRSKLLAFTNPIYFNHALN
ncbi:CehA/McbA family metallohydrolase [Amphibacillus jilinensis]|uniref:CehA/McbA family metallohydrolase n=1 Tax=Amphibacillus jilinensis TaxID=1216008 RepID=UPI0002E79DBD|nr:CehA/McbA family metallohydrolase [Amphibacillus jilinensis]